MASARRNPLSHPKIFPSGAFFLFFLLIVFPYHGDKQKRQGRFLYPEGPQGGLSRTFRLQAGGDQRDPPSEGKGKIVSCDLNPLRLDPVPPTVVEITGDAFSSEIRARLVEEGPYECIISDAAPMTTGNRTVDTSRSEYLAEQVVLLASEQLAPHGNLVLKIFQGGGQEGVLRTMRSMFAKAKAFKPKACRDDSFEIYLIGIDKKA